MRSWSFSGPLLGRIATATSQSDRLSLNRRVEAWPSAESAGFCHGTSNVWGFPKEDFQFLSACEGLLRTHYSTYIQSALQMWSGLQWADQLFLQIQIHVPGDQGDNWGCYPLIWTGIMIYTRATPSKDITGLCYRSSACPEMATRPVHALIRSEWVTNIPSVLCPLFLILLFFILVVCPFFHFSLALFFLTWSLSPLPFVWPRF